MRSLARDLNVSPTAPARHFKGRIDLLQTIVKEGYQQAILATLGAVGEPESDPVAQLNAMAKALIHWSLANRAICATVFHPDVARHADEELEKSLADLAAVVRTSLARAQNVGWRAQEDPEVLFSLITITMLGLANNLYDTLYNSVVGPIDMKHADAVVDMLFSA